MRLMMRAVVTTCAPVVRSGVVRVDTEGVDLVLETPRHSMAPQSANDGAALGRIVPGPAAAAAARGRDIG